MKSVPEKLSTASAEHYTWGDACDGWFLLKDAGVHVIQERMPPGTAERRHYHSRARQLFYVLSGELTMRFDDRAVVVRAREAIHIPPETAHQAANEGSEAVEFLVISSPPSHGNRTNLE
jgi:mannose-6-phosphate isomerase-like protein (cupin superfamily)